MKATANFTFPRMWNWIPNSKYIFLICNFMENKLALFSSSSSPITGSVNWELQIEVIELKKKKRSYWTIVLYNSKSEITIFIYPKYKNTVPWSVPCSKWTINLWRASFCFETEFNWISKSDRRLRMNSTLYLTWWNTRPDTSCSRRFICFPVLNQKSMKHERI